MELIFLLIFIFFIFLNVVLGLISSRVKKRKQLEAAEKISEKKPSLESVQKQKPSVGYDSFLGTQTAESIVRPLYEEPEKAQRLRPQRTYEGSTSIPEEIAPTIDEIAPFPGGEVPAAETEQAKPKKQEQPFYQKSEAELIEAARQRADLRKPMVDLTGLAERVEISEVDRKALSEMESIRSEVEAREIETVKAFETTKASPEGAIRATEVSPVRGSPEGERRISSNLWILLQSLPSLQRAVVLSEILGQPKGIKPHSH